MKVDKERLPGLALRLLAIFGLPLVFVALDVALIRYVRSCTLVLAVSVITLVVIIFLWVVYLPRVIKDLKRR